MRRTLKTTTPQLAACPVCGSSECVGDNYCGYTGQRIAPPVPIIPDPMRRRGPSQAPPAPEPRQGSRIVGLIAGILLLLGLLLLLFGLLSAGGKLLSSYLPNPTTNAGSG
jgi:predicted lipid-binding transport protein (Tim44 family)